MAPTSTQPTNHSDAPQPSLRPQRWSSETGYGNLHAHYCAAPFVLMPDEALLIEGELPPCRFANVVLWNRYMQSFDYTRRRVSLNRAQMTLGDGGSYRIVVAHRDPGLPNWLDTEGRASGLRVREREDHRSRRHRRAPRRTGQGVARVRRRFCKIPHAASACVSAQHG